MPGNGNLGATSKERLSKTMSLDKMTRSKDLGYSPGAPVPIP